MTRIVAFSPALALLAMLATGCQTNTNSENGAAASAARRALARRDRRASVAQHGGRGRDRRGRGAVTGAVVGNKIDESEARNRALIEARLGHPVSPGAVSIDDVIAMTKAGVNEDVIVGHVNNNGVTRPLNTADITYLTQNGVTPRVIQTMQNPAHQPPPQAVVVEESASAAGGRRAGLLLRSVLGSALLPAVSVLSQSRRRGRRRVSLIGPVVRIIPLARRGSVRQAF